MRIQRVLSWVAVPCLALNKHSIAVRILDREATPSNAVSGSSKVPGPALVPQTNSTGVCSVAAPRLAGSQGRGRRGARPEAETELLCSSVRSARRSGLPAAGLVGPRLAGAVGASPEWDGERESGPTRRRVPAS